MFSSLPVGNNVEALRVRKRLRRQSKMQFHRTLAGEVLQQIGIFCADSSSRNLGNIRRILRQSGMRQTKIRSSDRAHQNRDRPSGTTSNRSGAAIGHSTNVGLESSTLCGQLFVKNMIEEQYLAFDCVRRKGVKLLPVVHDHDFSG